MTNLSTVKKHLVVEALGQNGDGVVVADGQRLYIPYASPGDEVHIEVVLTKKNRYQVVSHEITGRGINYVVPPCPHYGICGSCQLQHLNDGIYQKFKRDKILGPLHYEGFPSSTDSLVENPRVLPPGLRRRANFTFRCHARGVELGYHKYHSYELLTLESCHILKPEIVTFMKPLMAVLGQSFAAGFAGEVFITLAHNGLDIHVEVQDRTPLSSGQKELWSQFAIDQEVCRLAVSLKGKEDFSFVRETPVVLFDGIAVESHCKGFLQPSQEADEALNTLVCAYLPPAPEKIADLFCGRGTFTLPLSRYAPVDAYEMDQPALATLKTAASLSQRPVETIYRDLFKKPLNPKELEKYDIVIIDPPRAGAENQVRFLADSGVTTIIYVSCNPLTFARDARILAEGGYKLTSVQPLDQFRWTVHVEVIAKFIK